MNVFYPEIVVNRVAGSLSVSDIPSKPDTAEFS